jgi:aryl-alcohol dehydrogenase-like predicted oxidoreductase
MKYITIDKTNIKTSKLAYGTASLHHIFSSKKRLELLKEALTLGISHFDTSPYYGFGLSELDLGLLCKNQRDRVTITTKVGLYSPIGSSTSLPNIWTRKIMGRITPTLTTPEVNWNINRAMLSLEDSLKRMKTDYVDFLCLHEPDLSLIYTDEFLRWLEKIVSQGKVRYTGLAGEPKTIIPWLKSDDNAVLKIIQTRDGLKEEGDVDFMTEAGRKPQFTYGYVSANESKDIGTIMKNAFSRNNFGSVIVSTRKKSRLLELSNLV